MKKNLNSLLLALLAATVMVGCDTPSSEPSSEPSSQPQSEQSSQPESSQPEKAELPEPFDSDKEGAATFNFAASNITAANFKEFANRDDIHYIDLRDAKDYTPQHLEGFEMVEYFAKIAGNAGQLFTKDANGIYQANYKESVEILEQLLPKDEVLFLMCQSGGRVAQCMQLMEQYGWDMSKVYNIGGMNQYKETEFVVENVNVTLEQANNGLTVLAEGTKNYTQATTNSKLIAELPNPFKDTATTFNVADSNISSSNFDQYAERTDVRYIDLRNAADYTKSHLAGFECVEFFANILDQSSDHSGNQLFYKVTNQDQSVDFVARYAESVEILEDLFPKTETIFFMCQSGGRVATAMQILQKYGWDMNRIYNIGGMNQYGESKYRVDCQLPTEASPLVTKKGSFTEKASGYDYTMVVYVQVDDQGKITNVAPVGGYTSPSYWTNASKWFEGKDAYCAQLKGKTLNEVKALLDGEDKLTGIDAVASASLTSRRVVKAVIAALEPAPAE